MINELSKSTNVQAAKRVTQWIEKSKNITKQLVAFTIESKGIRNLHQLWIRRSKQITKGMHSLKLYFKTGEKKLLLKYRAHLKKAGAILKEFKAARAAYFKEHKLKLEK